MILLPRQLSSGIVTKNLRPVLKSAGPADAAGAFRILVTSPEILFLGNRPQAMGAVQMATVSLLLQLNDWCGFYDDVSIV
jgi:hypothetical protein